jgi:mannose-6-phosphate isomerase-like protein (cupin superfamily)
MKEAFSPLDQEPIRPNEALRVQPFYTNESFSVALIALKGINTVMINYLSTTTYKVITGSGIMHIGDEQHTLQPDSFVTVPRNTPYYDEGEVVMWATSTPPFDYDSVQEVEQ